MFSMPQIGIPVLIFYGLFTIYLIGYTLFGLFNLLHLVKFGVANKGLVILVLIFVCGSIALAAASIFALLTYDASYVWSPDASASFIQKNVFPGL